MTNTLSLIVARLRKFWVIPALLVITACSTAAPNGNVGPGMTPEAYLAMEDRASYEANQDARSAILEDGRQRAYLRGDPVTYGNGRTGYTLQWNRAMRTAYVYPGHTTGAMGLDTSAMMAYATDTHGNLLGGQGGSPAVLLANVATQEGVGRFFARGAFQVVGAASSGAIAAQIHANAACKEDCGSPIQVIANSGSTSTATGTGTATVSEGCVTCGILD